jgi:nitrogen fixation/metabolism regulation signal transduction histidine kinase
LADEITWRSVEVEAGSTETIESWLESKDPSVGLENARFKRAVRALLVENARLRSVLGHCPRGIAVLDEQGNLTGHNRELTALLGVTPALGEPMAQYFAKTDNSLLDGVVARAGTTRRAAAVLRIEDGGDGRDIEFLAATLPSDKDRSIGVVLAGEDRTAAIHDEAERRTIDDANRIGAWAMGNAATLREVEAFRTEAEQALEAGDPERAKNVLAQLKSVLSRHEGRPSGTPARSDVGAVARRAARLSWVGRARRNVAIHVEVDEPVHVAFSDRDLSQVLANILDNAVHAVEGAGKFGFVVISASRVPTKKTVEIAIKDDGVGIAPHRLKDCFELVETERADGGRGVGLAIARALVESVGGTIRAISEPGRGTTVMIELPEAIA